MLPVAVVLSEQEREVLRLLDSPWGDLDDIEHDVLERLARLHYASEFTAGWPFSQAGRRFLGF